MKKSIITTLLLILHFGSMTAQQLLLPDDNKESFKYSYLQLDVNFLNYPIRNVNTNGLSVNGAAVFGDRLATGLSIDITDSRKLSFAQAGLTEPNTFEYSQISFYNEVFFHPNSRIDISLPIKMGVGHATVNPKDKFIFGETLLSNKDVLAGDYFFVSELGANVSVHLVRTIDFNVGGSYRLTAGANGIVQNDDFFNYSIHAGLRFRIAGKKTK